ncbi:RNA methyltransferase, TrmA family [Desulfobulbus propionicus DSM 2032]|uniref:RNA methyltransferase, TrmA family n=1 Tax=Desulfobulbus propionicus (strain ATCC 33891 / DSM 2032 / VKM B-1956 / 1pr3) TaxID=577650 RepID=A0A7U3YKS8_DESPD|nr:class I SAM-dependent RNA methyltransferase [Desulfobulbus propionicus]ADW17093.1 RNA methyltransferase, TrmA family [Desulfobulbus propionicus DSM 2032]
MEHTLTIPKVIAGGKGLGTLADGMKVMVAGVLPGERVTVRETRIHRGYKEASLVRVEEPAPERILPPCPHYGLCGGCDLQHGSYPTQLAIKRSILDEALRRSRLDLPPDHPGPALSSPQPFGYRHRLRLHLDQVGRLGFHQGGSNEVVPIRRCLLATEPINRAIGALVDAGWPARLRELVSAVELIHSPADDRVILVLQATAALRPDSAADLVTALNRLADNTIVQAEPIGRSGDRARAADLCQDFAVLGHAYRLCWDHRCFFQVNVRQNPRLIELALGLLPLSPPPRAALDLFCGMGNFSIPLGLMGTQVSGVEHNRTSVHWAEHNSRAAGLTTARFRSADVGQALRSLVARKARFDCVLLDPPRQGLGKTAALLARLGPQHILSISCDPATLARDLALIVQNGYRIVQVTPVDMFPQTHHIETVALLERN